MPSELIRSISTEADPSVRDEDEEWAIAVESLRTFFHPRSVAVIGASRRRGTIAGEVLHNLLSFGFQGAVYPVNPNATVVQSVVAYPSVEAVPGPVDLAVVVVPADDVLAIARACARKAVRALVVISSGFAETGAFGRDRQDALLAVCRAAGMRLIGPNCMGILNTDPTVRLNAMFVQALAPLGRVAFMSQSGALGAAVMDYARSLGLGLSTFASVGNKADVSGNDLIRYWEQDAATDLILLYLESFGNPRKFSRIARRVARRKPIVAVKGGRSPAGARATGSHTGALLAASDVTVDALFHQVGVIRTDTLQEMFDVASLLASQPPPQGRRVGILTNAGGPGILCADACAAHGLDIVPLDAGTQSRLRALLSPHASVENPVDMVASATPDQYRQAIRLIGADPTVDAVVAIFVPPLVTRSEDVAQAIVDGTRSLGRAKPVVSVFMQSRGVPPELRTADVQVPSYAFPENAAIALARTESYGEWLAKPLLPPARFPDIARDEAAAIVERALGRNGGWLSASEAHEVLSCYGLPVAPQRVVMTADDAAEAARRIGGNVALKAVLPGVVHKTEAGGVRLSVRPNEVHAVAAGMLQDLKATHLVVQAMAAPGIEMIVGVVHDRQFGPVVACGAGGVLVELLRDVAVRVAPLSTADAEEMVSELRTHPLLAGYRGGPPHDARALVEAVLRVSVLVEELPAIAELDLNPIIVHAHGATVVDARIRVAGGG